MKHWSEEELVENYCGESLEAEARLHLEECEECAAAYARLEGELAAMRTMDIPERDGAYGERVWSQVASRLPATQPSKAGVHARWWNFSLGRGLAYAAGCALVVAGAFYLGTVYEHYEHHKMILARGPKPAPPAAPPKVVVVVLGDHLDRSERLLVELKHADGESPELVAPMRDEARSLLAANHVFRDDAEKSGDTELTQALDHLDRLLTDMTNQPGGLNAAAIARLQQEMNTNGLLFEVRVLRSQHPHRDTAVRVVAKGGTA